MRKSEELKGTIRNPRIADIKAVNELYRWLGRTRTITLKELKRTLSRSNQRMALHVLPGGLVAGLVTWTVWPPSLSFPQPVCFIQEVVVRPEIRCRGIGTSMLEHVLRWGRKHRIRTFQLQAATAGRPARAALYRKMGFAARNKTFFLVDER